MRRPRAKAKMGAASPLFGLVALLGLAAPIAVARPAAAQVSAPPAGQGVPADAPPKAPRKPTKKKKKRPAKPAGQRAPAPAAPKEPAPAPELAPERPVDATPATTANPSAAGAPASPAESPELPSSSDARASRPANDASSGGATGPSGSRAPASPQAPEATGPRLHVGARYRGVVLPKAFFAPFARGGNTFFFHAVGVEAELRWSRLSVAPALTYMSLTTGGDLFADRTRSSPGYFSFVKSDLHTIILSVDVTWIFPLGTAADFELGLGLGAGIPFGTLINNWVYETDAGPLAFGTRTFAACRTVNDGIGCRPQDHASPTPIRVGGYEERGWFSGGSAPSIVPWVSIPQVGVRFRVSNDVALRVGAGLSLTGLWFGLGGTYRTSGGGRAP